ncbi:uncharacterized protein [Triticum aestivum]|uniref:uncharacterized protein n=1 Tax=Triticum aestivum TaxID=4565 RepID=UPI001D02003A|nr:uncharacterized protein LOC123041343 [Triticum aestivum]
MQNFASTLKHKRHEILVENLIASLDVEEKARAKDTIEKRGEVQPTDLGNKNKGKNKPIFDKPVKTTTVKKKFNKVELECYAYGKPRHFSKECLDCADRKGKTSSKTDNMVTASNTDGSQGILPS